MGSCTPKAAAMDVNPPFDLAFSVFQTINICIAMSLETLGLGYCISCSSCLLAFPVILNAFSDLQQSHMQVWAQHFGGFRHGLL